MRAKAIGWEKCQGAGEYLLREFNVVRRRCRLRTTGVSSEAHASRGVAILALFIGMTTSLVCGQTARTGSLRVVVSGDNGPIVGAQVVVREQAAAGRGPEGAAEVGGATDSRGRFMIELAPGTYRVSASVRGVLPAGGRVTIRSGQRGPTEIRLIVRYPDCRVVKCAL